MHITLPYGLILIFIALSFFYYTIQKTRIRKQQRRERLEEKREELLQSLRNKADKKAE
jgi:hypothetical protein